MGYIYHIILLNGYLFPFLFEKSNWVYFALLNMKNNKETKEVLETLEYHNPSLFKK